MVVESLFMSRCWACSGGDVSPEGFICLSCEKIQPPKLLTYFQIFGLEPVFEVDLPQLESLYFQLQSRVHPDRFVSESSQEQGFATQQSMLLNEAYKTLKDPLSRGKYLLSLFEGTLEGIEGAEKVERVEGVERVDRFKGSKTCEVNEISQDIELLQDMMTYREALENAPVETHNHLQQDQKESLIQLKSLFKKKDYKGARQVLTRMQYINRLLREV